MGETSGNASKIKMVVFYYRENIPNLLDNVVSGEMLVDKLKKSLCSRVGIEPEHMVIYHQGPVLSALYPPPILSSLFLFFLFFLFFLIYVSISYSSCPKASVEVGGEEPYLICVSLFLYLSCVTILGRRVPSNSTLYSAGIKNGSWISALRHSAKTLKAEKKTNREQVDSLNSPALTWII